MDEFALIRHFFATGGVSRGDVTLGIGDDAALLRVPPGHELAVSTDNLVADVHFPDSLDARAVGHRALAVNLSDLAAMGAQPAWALMSLTLPQPDEAWLAAFARGFLELAHAFEVALVGGNLARGPLNIAVTVHGFVPAGQALTRAGAETGDAIYVTGHPGDAAAGLRLIQSGGFDPSHPCVQRFGFPRPRIAAGLALRGLASAAIDVSDGLLADLGHLLETHALGARLDEAAVPLSPELLALYPRADALGLALGGGDDYELCFTLPPARQAEAAARFKALDCAMTRIGIVESAPGLRGVNADGVLHEYPPAGYRHF
ncbi:MAG TPA: thiamine-phosphate kinase [Gammaproteobacteria bacterium]|nr:thiamine-phosphate kinase [Gammaproteobacteria bacterium]